MNSSILEDRRTQTPGPAQMLTGFPLYAEPVRRRFSADFWAVIRSELLGLRSPLKENASPTS